MTMRRTLAATATAAAIGGSALLGAGQLAPASAALPTGASVKDAPKDVQVFHRSKNNSAIDIKSASLQTSGARFAFRATINKVHGGYRGNPEIKQNFSVTVQADDVTDFLVARAFEGPGFFMFKRDDDGWTSVGGVCSGGFGVVNPTTYQISLTKRCFPSLKRITHFAVVTTQTNDPDYLDNQRIFARDEVSKKVNVRIAR